MPSTQSLLQLATEPQSLVLWPRPQTGQGHNLALAGNKKTHAAQGCSRGHGGTTQGSCWEEWEGSQLHRVGKCCLCFCGEPLDLTDVHFTDEKTQAESWSAVPGLTLLWIPVSGGSLQSVKCQAPGPCVYPRERGGSPGILCCPSKTVTRTSGGFGADPGT